MVAVIKSEDLGVKICNLLGLDASKIQGVALRCEVGDVAIVEVRRILGKNEANELETELTKYKLIKEES